MQPAIRTLLTSLFLFLASIPLFYNLDGPAIFIYDEAIYANNALEMALHGDPVVLKNNGAVSLYNTKPPLVIWLQALAIKAFGPGEWAIRLPTALAALATLLLLLLFAHRTLKDLRIGWVAILVLVTSGGYLRNHVARSGDLDGMLVFWITGYALLAFDYLLQQKPVKDWQHFTWIGLGIVGAFYTKSVAAFLPLPGLALAAIYRRRLIAVLKKPSLYLVAVSVFLLCAGYYLIRENLAPGYLEKVLFSEYSRFTENIMPWHEKPFWFYLQNMWRSDYFMPYLLLLPLALFFGIWKNTRWRNFTIMAMIFCLSYFLLIAYPEVKLNYYDAPLYPMLSLIIGVGGVSVWKWTMEKWQPAMVNHSWSFAIVLLLLFFMPLRKTFSKIQQNKPTDKFEREGFALRALEKQFPEEDQLKVLMYSKYSEHYDQAGFYVKAINFNKNARITLKEKVAELQTKDHVLCCQKPLLDSLQEKYALEVKASYGDCQYLLLESER